MGWRINKITFENFKVFKDRCDIELNGKNFLLFGENGSGKSSIGWGLYTFLQSVLKMPDLNETQKYFNPAHDQHLRNRFSDDADYSGILIEFIDPVSRHTLIKEDSIRQVDTHTGLNPSIPYSLAASDFLNYRYLNSLFDFRNSENNDIFPILYQEVFPIDSLSHTVIDINGISKGNIIKDWWIILNEILKELPRDVAPRTNNILQTGAPWESFNTQLRIFNEDLRLYLDSIELKANHLLQTKFNINANIILEYSDAALENIPDDPVNGNLKLHVPEIHLHARFLHPGAANQEVKHPRSFFNEASLSKMALALRLAITENRLQDAPDLCKILVIDDLLISLDMANRLSVIDILLDYSSSFQMIILTHDRSFFNIVKNKINNRKQTDNWKYSQIYIKPDLTHSNIPETVIAHMKNGLDQALDHFLSEEFEAAVVCLRKECEGCLKRLVPFIRIIDHHKATKGELSYVSLYNMIKKYNEYIDEHFTLDLSLRMPHPTPNLNTFRDLLLNKAAHNDYGSPRFNIEIEQAFGEISILQAIRKFILVPSQKINTDNFEFSILDNAGALQSLNFTFGDVFSVLSVNGTDYLLNVQIMLGQQVTYLEAEIKNFCNTHAVPLPDNILQHIKNTRTGNTLDSSLQTLKS